MKLQLARCVIVGTLMLTLVAAGPAKPQGGPYKYIVFATADPEASACTFYSSYYGGYICPSLRSAVLAANANPGSTIQLAHGATYILEYPPVTGDDAWSGDLNFTTYTHVNFGNVICFANCQAMIQGAPGWHDRLVTIENGAWVDMTGIVFKGGNLTSGDGGGIKVVGSGQLYLINSTVTGNKTAAGNGGGIAITDLAGQLTMDGSVVSLNQANYGGGVSSGGSTDIYGSAIISNTALKGGAYDAFNAGTRHAFNNSTLSGNTATEQNGAFEDMDGVRAYFNNVTVTNNDAPGNTGGVESVFPAYIANSVFAGNTINHLPARDCAGSFHSTGYNLIGNAEGCVVALASGDRFGGNTQPINALLGPLQFVYGTFVHSPLEGSPLIDTGNPVGCRDAAGTLLQTDQLGNPRPETTGGRCDIGAVENSLSSNPTPTPIVHIPVYLPLVRQ